MLSNGERFGHVAKAQTIASSSLIKSQGIACDADHPALICAFAQTMATNNAGTQGPVVISFDRIVGG
jgi:hypothetical protein